MSGPIELRQRTGWDAGIPGEAVLIHEVRGDIAFLVLIGAGPTERHAPRPLVSPLVGLATSRSTNPVAPPA